MKLYYSPGACSLGIHILLEEIGRPFALERVDLAKDEQKTPGYLAFNPKGKIPVLVREDGSKLTEFGAIALWLARSNPEAGLIPADLEGEARAVEALDYAVGTVHAHGFTRFARPGNFAPETAKAEVQALGKAIYTRGVSLLAEQLGGREWMGGSFSAADTALFYVSRWHKRIEVALPPALAAHYERMLARPAVQRAMATEGIEP